MTPPVVFESVSFGYNSTTPVLDDVSVEIEAGLVLVRGPNGAGKSTLIELLAGALTPHRGRITVLGRAADDPALRRLRAVVRQQLPLYPELTVEEHVALVARWRGVDAEKVHRRLDQYEVKEERTTPVKELSTGNQQRVAIVLSTLGEPQLLLLDEPFDNLDTHAADQLVLDIDRWRVRGATVLVAAHTWPTSLGFTETVHLPGIGEAPYIVYDRGTSIDFPRS
jgi:ABC-2 type transport system ATP-binding protein